MNIKSAAKSVFFKLSSVALVANSLYLLINEEPSPLMMAEVVGCLGLSVGTFAYSIQDFDNTSTKIIREMIPHDYGTIDV